MANRTTDWIARKNFSEALKIILEITNQFPDDASSLVLQGNLFGAMKKYDQARDSFQRALRIDPQNAEAREGLNQVESLFRRN